MPVIYNFREIPQSATEGIMADRIVGYLQLSERVRRYMTSHSNLIPSNVTLAIRAEYLSILSGSCFFIFEATIRRNGVLAALRGQRRSDSRSFRIVSDGLEAYLRGPADDFAQYIRDLVNFEVPEPRVPAHNRNVDSSGIYPLPESNNLRVRERYGVGILSESAIATYNPLTAITSNNAGIISTGTITAARIDPASVTWAGNPGVTGVLGFSEVISDNRPMEDPYTSRRALYEYFHLNGKHKNCTTCYHYELIKIFDTTDGTYTTRPMCTIKDIEVTSTCLCEHHRTEDLFICWKKS